MKSATTSAEFFDHIYREAPDPWNFAASDYEQGRYRSILDALGGRRYVRAFEPGCSIGILTAQLASLCDRVEAIDISPTAVTRVRERCKSLRNVNIVCGA